ncbi:uncharacterized protein L969DRAFT_92271 [Mixia osmundae IAM 14324]|uniref:DH domain-containing protein n=1 Tax=Mixia osmundae (strain CBS 9802 / IAM 14324 / JCM 22182 / KY 12970) TaxID=764103 RepID=G7DTG4_MIXOS|nr:uncharacterized protein L969DRAFT_92271 [Mixia osmundae IAM 14324]KEI42851.1 hypothetical protein L969DRAFT_92271 [Mixia osmundae IAM 14324]GAA93811.1 hypothetical protein E5Q_00457 [Mixia osmundae IAM 14324]
MSVMSRPSVAKILTKGLDRPEIGIRTLSLRTDYFCDPRSGSNPAICSAGAGDQISVSAGKRPAFYVGDDDGSNAVWSAHQDERRRLALDELVESEEGYLRDLTVFCDVYLADLPMFLPEAARELITRDARKLLDLHRRITARFLLNSDARHIIQVLIDEGPNLAIYQDFCARHSDAMDLIRQFRLTHKAEWELYERQCRLAVLLAPSQSSSSTLHRPTSAITFSTYGAAQADQASTPQQTSAALSFSDYAIKPIQRICRYPMLISGLIKLYSQTRDMPDSTRLPDSDLLTLLQHARSVLAGAAEAVDEARQVKQAEKRSALIAQRMHFAQAPRDRLVSDYLGIVQCVGALYHQTQLHAVSGPAKVRYMAAMLYKTHLVLAKVHKRSYEARIWLPLRALCIRDIKDDDLSDIAVPCAIQVQCQLDNNSDAMAATFYLGATCRQEKAVWLRRLQAAIDGAQSNWDTAADSHTNKIDDALIYSLYAGKPESKDDTLVANSRASILRDDLDQGRPQLRHVRAQSATDLPRSRISQTAATLLLGRSPSTDRADVDAALEDVFSDELQTARRIGCLEVREPPRRYSYAGSSLSSAQSLYRNRKLRRKSTLELTSLPPSRSISATRESSAASSPRHSMFALGEDAISTSAIERSSDVHSLSPDNTTSVLYSAAMSSSNVSVLSLERYPSAPSSPLQSSSRALSDVSPLLASSARLHEYEDDSTLRAAYLRISEDTTSDADLLIVPSASPPDVSQASTPMPIQESGRGLVSVYDETHSSQLSHEELARQLSRDVERNLSTSTTSSSRSGSNCLSDVSSMPSSCDCAAQASSLPTSVESESSHWHGVKQALGSLTRRKSSLLRETIATAPLTPVISPDFADAQSVAAQKFLLGSPATVKPSPRPTWRPFVRSQNRPLQPKADALQISVEGSAKLEDDSTSSPTSSQKPTLHRSRSRFGSLVRMTPLTKSQDELRSPGHGHSS